MCEARNNIFFSVCITKFIKASLEEFFVFIFGQIFRNSNYPTEKVDACVTVNFDFAKTLLQKNCLRKRLNFGCNIIVETVVLLSQRRPDTHIDIKLDLSELDITAAETKATYQEIKDYVLEKHGLKVSTLYISQVKAKCGIIERENYNKGKEGHRVPQCPKEKEDAIMDALKHFNMI